MNLRFYLDMQNHVNMPEWGEEERDVSVGQEAEVWLEEERGD